jgi:hypothetical protein
MKRLRRPEAELPMKKKERPGEPEAHRYVRRQGRGDVIRLLEAHRYVRSQRRGG